MARILDRSRKSSKVGGHKVAPLTFDSSGVSAETSDVSDVLFEYAEAVEIGTPELHQYAETTDGSTAEILTVPAGTAWRLVGLVHQQTNSANAANRFVTVSMRTVANADIEVLTSAVSTTGAETEYSFLFGADDRVGGTAGIAAQGTLTIDTVAANNETITINAVVFTWKTTLTGAANELLVNTNEAGTKATLEDAFGTTRTGDRALHTVTDVVYTSLEMTAIDFVADAMKWTANVKGEVGDLLTTTETMAGGANAWGASTLGDTTAGVGQANVVSALNYPEDSGPLLTAGEDVEILVTDAHADDDMKGYLFVIALTQDPTT